MKHLRALPFCLALSLSLAGTGLSQAADWPDELVEQIERIDEASPGELGVYVKRLSDGREMLYAADRPWYLSSTVKVPIAIAVLEAIEAGSFGLEGEMTLEATDKVDGSGDLVWQDDGATYTIEELIDAMLMQSDNTAANMLIRAVGVDWFNERARTYMGEDAVGELTDFAQIRYDIYSELHPDARELSNAQIVEIAGANIGPARVQAFSRIADIPADALEADTMEEAYTRYYARGLNMATLQGYGHMLEQLVTGELVDEKHMTLLYDYMKLDEPGDYRLEGGLPQGTDFIHKTGTQWEQACHIGVIEPGDGGAEAIIVAACAKGLDEAKEAGGVLRQVGDAIAETLLEQ